MTVLSTVSLVVVTCTLGWLALSLAALDVLVVVEGQSPARSASSRHAEG